MTVTPHSVSIVAPQARWDDLREFWLSQGYELGDGVPLSATGDAPATHRGGHMWLTAAQAQTFTLRQNPASYQNGYTFGLATACMAQIRARDAGQNINHGATPDENRIARLSIDHPDGGQTLTAQAHFVQISQDAAVIPIDETPV